MTKYTTEKKQKKSLGKKSTKWNTKCLTCEKSCKQFGFVKIIKCPLYKKKQL